MGRGLPRRVERTRVSSGSVAAWYLGGAGYILRTPSTTLYIDPYLDDGGRAIPIPFSPEDASVVDAVICSHDHSDHTDPLTLGAWRTRLRPTIIGPEACIDLARGWGYPQETLRPLAVGESTVVNDVRIRAVPAFDPLARGASGHVIQAEGVTLLHCGDSRYFPEIGAAADGLQVDVTFVSVACNPPGQELYMTEADAGRAARDIGTRMLVPGHWDIWRQYQLDPRRIRTAVGWYAPETRVLIPRLGRRMSFTVS